MLPARIEQILAHAPEPLTIHADPNAAERYHGRYLTINQIPYALGNLIGQGDEAFVFELLSLRDGERVGVVKICRHPPGSSKYLTWAVPYRIESNPHSAIPDVEMYLAQLVRVPGGLVKVQPYLSPSAETDLTMRFWVQPILEAAQQSDIQSALKLLQGLIEQHGPRPELLEIKGRLLAQNAQWQEAREVLEQALDAYNQSKSYARFKTAVLLAEVHRQIYLATPGEGATLSLTLDDGTVLKQTGFSNPITAAEDDTLQDRQMYVLLEALADEPYFIPALCMLAETLLDTWGTNVFAEKVIQAIEQIDPESPDVPRLRELSRARFGEPSSARRDEETRDHETDRDENEQPEAISEFGKEFHDAYKPEPTRGQAALARYQSAISHFDAGDFYAAEQAAREAMELDRSSADYPLLLAEVLERQGKQEQALEVLERASLEFFDQAFVHQRLGDFYMAKEDFAAAEVSYLRALRSEPETPWLIKLGLGEACRRLGKRIEAIQWLRHAYQESQLNPDAALGLIYVLADRKGGASEEEYQEAIATITAMVRQHPESAELWVCQAQLQAQTAHYKEAIDSLRRAVELDPHHPFAANFLKSLEDWYTTVKRRASRHRAIRWSRRKGRSR